MCAENEFGVLEDDSRLSVLFDKNAAISAFYIFLIGIENAVEDTSLYSFLPVGRF